MSKKKSSKMKLAIKDMQEIYHPYKDGIHLDWMGYEISEMNFPTYHHITKQATIKSNGEKDDYSIANGAYLGDLSHSALHVIENIDPNLYNRWNELFRIINNSHQAPSESMNDVIKELQLCSEKVLDEHYNQEKNNSINKK